MLWHKNFSRVCFVFLAILCYYSSADPKGPAMCRNTNDAQAGRCLTYCTTGKDKFCYQGATGCNKEPAKCDKNKNCGNVACNRNDNFDKINCVVNCDENQKGGGIAAAEGDPKGVSMCRNTNDVKAGRCLTYCQGTSGKFCYSGDTGCNKDPAKCDKNRKCGNVKCDINDSFDKNNCVLTCPSK